MQILRSYALNAWFDRLQTLQAQLEDLSLQNLSNRRALQNEDTENSDEENHTADGPIDEEGMKSAILRYISSLDSECQRLKLDLHAAKIGSATSNFDSVRTLDQTMEKYSHVRLQMSNLLSETQSVDNSSNQRNWGSHRTGKNSKEV